VRSASNTLGGTANVPAFAKAKQLKPASFVLVLSVVFLPAISITVFDAPPPQVMVVPLARFTGRLGPLAGLVKVGGAGIVNAAPKLPTSAPPDPEMVYKPRERKVPEASVIRFPVGGKVWFPLGPVTLMPVLVTN
jgi:hypothetical protein